jgi:hypothetical protein
MKKSLRFSKRPLRNEATVFPEWQYGKAGEKLGMTEDDMIGAKLPF